jgi:hypothetical protein
LAGEGVLTSLLLRSEQVRSGSISSAQLILEKNTQQLDYSENYYQLGKLKIILFKVRVHGLETKVEAFPEK